MQTAAMAVERITIDARSTLAGSVTISAPPLLAAEFLTHPLVTLQKQNPKLTINVIGEARNASLDHREADIAVRLNRPDRGDFTIVKLGEMTFRLYANPDYLAQTPEEERYFIGYKNSTANVAQQGVLEKIASGRDFSFFANSVEIQQSAARSGAGIAALPDFVAQNDPMLTSVLPSKDPVLSRDIWLIVHSDIKNAKPIRAVIQQLQDAFSNKMSPFKR